MADTALRDWLLPPLIDRLCDDDRRVSEESRDKRAVSEKKLRDSVLRDLGWLLNAPSLGGHLDAEAFPRVARSVLNFGIPSFIGGFVQGHDPGTLERLMWDVVATFEPRIQPDTLTVRLDTADLQDGNTMIFRIEGELRLRPVPVRIAVRTEVDLDLGHIRVLSQPGY
ncbi:MULTISPECIES: type VI secretion system baseplate subunit TssE [unclassified Azospirillum]|uniref:type VI secretion system baseplate subunit TssE n=1 Tax=unclassified Azospirillum TaxID=2630922 RepID=UPI000B6F866E|nr:MULTISPECIES: type VI secretion system baseplate subunit TssE [unclassified Azospirillum]SNS92442.1 type VI secretion system protein ImpF [Azospirillum sp. RU38E]SNT09372.1 type VI secretion system protein ImpF [Azospirillum sp. RU37A]